MYWIMQIILYMYKQDALILSQEFVLLKTEINPNPTQQLSLSSCSWDWEVYFSSSTFLEIFFHLI